MGDVHYMISEAAKHVGVESHVLRYWEEELDLPIGRTEMGHRHYTEEDIQLFSCIKELKEQGLLLKEIKQLLPDMLRTKALLKTRKSDAPKAAASINEVADPQFLFIQQTTFLFLFISLCSKSLSEKFFWKTTRSWRGLSANPYLKK